MTKYRNRTVTVEAVQWLGNNMDEITEFVGDGHTVELSTYDRLKIGIPGQGYQMVDRCYWVVGKPFFVCPPNVFPNVYELANPPLSNQHKPPPVA